MRRYGISPDRIQILDGFESYMYEFNRDGQNYILRIGHSFRRNDNLIHGEVDWINYLARGGASVSRAILSNNERLVERINDGKEEQFLVTAFVRAAGRPIQKGKQWNDELFERYGRLIGRMHALSRSYEPANPAWRRPDWDDPLMLDVESWLPATEPIAGQRYRDLLTSLSTYPRDAESYGLIHQDAHAGNFFVDRSGRITLFDFDDCCYSWYANDIAIVLFYAMIGEEDEQAFTRTFMRHFFRGYRLESDFSPAWLQRIHSFLKLREIDLYAVIHRSFDVDNLEDRWVAYYMQGRKERIHNDIPFVDFDFEELADILQ